MPRAMFALVGSCAIGLMGCASGKLYSVHRADSQANAGSAHVAVVAVAPWESYRQELQPTFKLSPEEALAQSLPTTLALEEKFLSAFATSLRIALPKTTVANTSTVTAETGKETLTKSEEQRTESSADPAGLTLAGAPEGTRTASSLPPAASVLSTSLGFDGMMRYWAATALYQEVQLINRYVRDAPTRDQYEPYLVRVQVTLLPLLRNSPYDAYTAISFFDGRWGDWDIDKNILVIPLLVTDDIEAALHSRSVDQLQRISVGLSALTAGLGAGGDAQGMAERLQSVAGHDLNSAFTVARVSDNTVRCRFGAVQQAESHFAMTAQTHYITLLLLRPKRPEGATDEPECPRCVRLTARTSFADVEKGTFLKPRTEKQAYGELRAVLHERFGIDPPDEKLRPLFLAVASNQPRQFSALVQALAPGATNTDALWVDVAAIRNRSPFSSDTFALPKPVTPSMLGLFKRQTPVLFDDGKTTTSATVYGGADLDSARLTAWLSLESRKVLLPAQAVRVSSTGREATVSLPSLASFKLVQPDGSLPDGEAKLTLQWKDGAGGTLLDAVPCRYLQRARGRQPSFSMVVRSRFVAATSKRTGTLQVVFADIAPTSAVKFSVEGADATVKAEPAGTVQADGSQWRVKGPVAVTLSLENLTPLSAVTITAVDEADKEALPEVATVVVASLEPVSDR